MPIYWKITSKNYLLNIFIFTLFFIFIIIFFKLSRFTKYFTYGMEIKELLLLISIFIYKAVPFAIAITSLISAYLVCSNVKRHNEITAFSSLGLSPKKLFSPLIILSIFLSCGSGYIHFALSPLINSGLQSILHKKKQNKNLISTLMKVTHKDSLYIDINKKDNTDFLYINTDKDFSWTLCDKVVEDGKGLHFLRPHYFRAIKEKEGFDTIILSEDEEAYVTKATLFNAFPNTTFSIDAICRSWEETVSTLFYLLYPVTFTLLGITLSFRIYPIIITLLTLAVFISFAIGTLLFTLYSAFLSLLALLSAAIFYFLTLRKYMQGSR
ncbi:MAG: hypothetical protein SP4CHLAM5_00670 [Chlamydiia bacterium]|nr:hypothetical protein [Chlamydiia bacterium]MCH9617944.1 hypothetical protein [Chlamydiia bacterium]MCH9624577.1 hypothetical protein [Chlamydiia bacterium]